MSQVSKKKFAAVSLNKQPTALPVSDTEDVVVLPGSFNDSVAPALEPGVNIPDILFGRTLHSLYDQTTAAIGDVKEKTSKASVALDKFAEIMEVVEVDHIRQILENANKISAMGGSFADVISEVLEYIKDPASWLKYVLPVVLGVGVYLIVKEKNVVLIPLMKGLCMAGAVYFAIPEAQRLLEWLSSLTLFSAQSPLLEGFMPPLEDLLSDEDSFLGPLFNKILKFAYGIDISFKQVIHLLTTVPKALDGVNRIWGLFTTLWSEIKLRIYSLLGWQARSGDMSIDRLVDSASDLVLQLKTDKLVFTHNVAMRVEELIKAHTVMIQKLSAENKGALLGYVRSSLDALKKAQIEIIRRIGTGFGNRVEPVMIVFFGDPGQGKTVFSQELEKALVKDISTPEEWKAYCESSRNAVFTVPPGLKHWETVSNSTKIVRIDELWAEKEIAGMENSQSVLLQQLINTAPFTPPMAFEMKGMISLEPHYVIATTNMNSLAAIQTLVVPTAVRRRMHYVVQVIKGDRPFEEKIDLTNIKLQLCEVGKDNGCPFVPVGTPITAPELVSLVRAHRESNLRQQRAAFVNADVQADYLLGLTADPREYLANLRADMDKKKTETVETVLGYKEKCDLIQEIGSAELNGALEDLDGPEWHALNFVPMKYMKKDYLIQGNMYSRGVIFSRFLTFCKITGIAWSFEKFLEIFNHDVYSACLSMPSVGFSMWLTSFKDELLSKRTEVKSLMTSLWESLKNLPKLISQWINGIIPTFVRRTDVLLSVGGILATAWYFSDEIKKLFYSDDLYPQSDEKYMRKGQKAIVRDRKYMFRMAGQHAPEEHFDAGPSYAEGYYTAQMGDRIPELVKAAHTAYLDNLYEVRCDQVEGRLGFALFIKEDMVLFPCHFAQLMNIIIDEHPNMEHYVEFVNPKLTKKVPMGEILQQGFGDMALEYFVTKIDLGKQHRDITVHFPNSGELNKFQVDFRNNMDLVIQLDGVTYAGLKSTWHHTAELNFSAFNGDRRKIHSVVRVDALKFKAGDCGIPYIAMTGPAAGKIVAIHVGGNTLYQQGLGIFLTKQILLSWFRNIHPGKIIKFNEPRRVILDDIVPVDRVSFTNAHCQFYGNQKVVEYAKTNVSITKGGIDERLANYDRVLPTSYNIEHIHDVTRMIGGKFLANMPRPAHRLTLHETIFGIPGEISSIDMSTSAGFPLQGTSLDKKYWLLPDGSMNMEVLGELRKFVEEDIKSYRAGIYPNHIFKIFPKDEKLPLIDVTEKNKVRTINGAPVLHILEQKMFFSDFVHLAEQNSLELNHLIGVNLGSMDGDDFARRVLQMNPTGNQCFGGDISKFEFNQKYDIQMSIFDNIVLPCLSDFTEAELAVARMIWDHSAMSVHKWEDKIYMVNGSRASGEYMTSLGNSLYVMTAIAYSYYKAVDFNLSLLRTFYDNVYVVCMGDDNCGSVTDTAASFFNQFAIRDGLKDLGLKYTSPEKDDITEPFMNFDSMVMLQCTPRYDKLMGRYVWQQHLASILEISQWTIKDKRKPDLNVWKSNVLESLKKLCVHDVQMWNRYIPLFQKMVIGHDVDIPTWSYRGMQAIVFGEEDLRFRFKEDYKPQPALTFEAQAGPLKRPQLPPLDLGGFLYQTIFVRVTAWGTFVLLSDREFVEHNIDTADVVLINGPNQVRIPCVETGAFWNDYFAQSNPAARARNVGWYHYTRMNGRPKI